ncbi:glycosyltransferase family 39 protein [Crocinitomicaceae bacterium]|nr:glycosyltransferase family 39 protein [Crocinitomicaceae bacterium]
MTTYLIKYKQETFLWLAILANLILGVISLELYPIGLDEPFSIFHAQMNIGEIITNLKGGNNPPLYEIILHFWIKVFGISPVSVRFPSLIFSLITIYFTYRTVVIISSFKTAVLSILFISFSNYYIYFTHEARAYSLFLMLTALSVYLIIKITENKALKMTDFISLGIVATLLIYSHYFGVFVIIFQSAFFIFINQGLRNVITKYVILCACVLLFYSPYLLEIYRRFIDSAQNGTWVKPTENLGNLHDIIFWFTNKSRIVYGIIISLFYASLWKLYSRLETRAIIKDILRFLVIPIFFLTSLSIFFSLPFIWRLTEMKVYTFIFIAVTLLLFTFSLIYYSKRHGYQIFIIGSFLVPLIVFFAVSFFIPIWVDRYLIFILPSFYITLAMSVNYLFRGKSYYISAIILISMMAYSFDPSTSDHNNVDKMVDHVKDVAQEESIIIINPKHFELTFSYHFDKSIFSNYNFFPQSLMSRGVYSVNGVPGLRAIKNHPDNHIIYVDGNSNFLYPDNGVYERLKISHKLIGERIFNKGIRVTEFAEQKKRITQNKRH